MSESSHLLAEYVAGSEAAFREIVARYVDLVYSTALRSVDGDAHLAEDVAQTVFLDLARKAHSLSREVCLGGWLHRHTSFVAAKMMRSKRRREVREREAVAMRMLEDESDLSEASQILDAAINQLASNDRDAIVLRFFEKLDFRAVGEALGSNEAAAQKRVSRALEKLNRLLTKQGMKFTTVGLSTALSAHAVTAAPIGLAANIAANTLLALPATASPISLIQYMISTKAKAAAALSILTLSLLSPLILHQQSSASIARLKRDFAEQNAASALLVRENDVLASRVNSLGQTTARNRDEFENFPPKRPFSANRPRKQGVSASKSSRPACVASERN